MGDMNRLSQTKRFKLALFKWTSLPREAKQHELSIIFVDEVPEWDSELQDAIRQLRRDAGLVRIADERRRARVVADVSLGYFGDVDGTYPDSSGE